MEPQDYYLTMDYVPWFQNKGVQSPFAIYAPLRGRQTRRSRALIKAPDDRSLEAQWSELYGSTHGIVVSCRLPTQVFVGIPYGTTPDFRRPFIQWLKRECTVTAPSKHALVHRPHALYLGPDSGCLSHLNLSLWQVSLVDPLDDDNISVPTIWPSRNTISEILNCLITPGSHSIGPTNESMLQLGLPAGTKRMIRIQLFDEICALARKTS